MLRDGTGRLLAVHVPEVAFVQEREEWVHVEEILLDEFIQHRPCWHTEAALGLEVVDVLGEDVCQVANVKKWIVRVHDIGTELRRLLGGPGVHRGAGIELLSR